VGIRLESMHAPYELEIEEGVGTRPRRHALAPGRHVIGSSPEADIVIDSRYVSRRHAAITILDAGGLVEDLGSTNGTFLDGLPVQRAAFSGEAELVLGSVRTRLRSLAPHPVSVFRNPPTGGHDEDEQRPDAMEPSSTHGWNEGIDDLVAALHHVTDKGPGEGLELVQRLMDILRRRTSLRALAVVRQRTGTTQTEILAFVGADPAAMEASGEVLATWENVGLLGIRLPEGDRAPNLPWSLVLALARLGCSLEGGTHSLPTGVAAKNVPPFPGPPVASESMRRLLRQAERLALTGTSLILQGETGTGKDHLARWIHARSPRAAGPFITMGCRELSSSLLEAELFGIEEGVATDVKPRDGHLVTATGGTFVLQDLDAMPAELQEKLLRVLEERTVWPLGSREPVPIDVRLITTVNTNVDALLEGNILRRDLYYRLAGAVLDVPSLRDRRADIPILAMYFLAKARKKFGIDVSGITVDAMNVLVEYSWPGNVRELFNAIHEAVPMLEGGDALTLDTLPRWIQNALPLAVRSSSSSTLHLADWVARAEREAIAMALTLAGAGKGQIGRAATILGISESTLYRKMQGKAFTSTGMDPQKAEPSDG